MDCTYAGVAGGADVILIPEIPYEVDKVAQHLLAREALGARFSIVGRPPKERTRSAPAIPSEPGSALAVERLGGIGERLVRDLEHKTNKEMRSVILGHLQRGGVPTSADRLLATRFGARALELVLEQQWGTMVALQPPDVVAVPLARVVDRVRTVPFDCDSDPCGAGGWRGFRN